MLGKNAEKELLANMEEIRYMTRSIVRKSAIFAKYQEAYIEYLQSVDSYDHTKGKSLHNYAYSRIRHRLMSIFRKNRNIYQEYGSNKLEEQLSCRQDVESELRAAEFAVDYLEVEKEMMKVYMDAPKTIQYGILAICNEDFKSRNSEKTWHNYQLYYSKYAACSRQTEVTGDVCLVWLS